MFWICEVSWDASLDRMEQLTTGRETPQARPNATLEGTNTYRTFWKNKIRNKNEGRRLIDDMVSLLQ